MACGILVSQPEIEPGFPTVKAQSPNNWTTREFPILDTSALSDICLASVFFQSVACLFLFLTVSFEEQKFLILIKSNLSTYFFMDCAFGVIPKKPMTNTTS